MSEKFVNVALSTEQKEHIICSIKELGNEVTVSDVALATGLPVSQVSSALQELAYESHSHLLVTQKGEVSFKFVENLSVVIATKNREFVFAHLKRVSTKLCFFIARVLFGVTLLTAVWMFRPAIPSQFGAFLDFNVVQLWNWFFLGLYIMLVFGGPWLFELLMIPQQTTEKYSQGRKNNSSHDSVGWMSIADALGIVQLANIFSWHYQFHAQPCRDLWHALNASEDESLYTKASIFYVCFSFVFGDGSSNYDYEETKWQVVAEVIRENRGAVIVEQIAPYLCCAPDDEDSILPVLVRFGGHPEVSRSGHLIYVFPELTKGKGVSFVMPKFLVEHTCRFSHLPFPYLLPVWFISAFTLLISYSEYLHPELVSGWWRQYLSEGLTNWQFVLPFSVVFCLFPSLRFIYVWLVNSEIEERNKLRAYFAHLLDKPEPALYEKLRERKEFVLLPELIDRRLENIRYTTEKTTLEQELPE
jgi:hypothetical protein